MPDYSIQIRVEAAAAQTQLRRLERDLRNIDKTAHRYRQTLHNTRQSLDLVTSSSSNAAHSTNSLRSNLQQIANNTRSTDNNLRLLNSHILALVNGVGSLTTQLQGAATGLHNVSSATHTASSQLSSSSQSFDNLASRITGVSTAALNLKNVFASLGSALTLSWVASTIFEFEKQLSAVKAVSGATGQAFDELRNKAQELGQTTIYTAGQAAEGMRAMAQAGFTTNEILQASDKVLALAQVGQMDLGRTAEIAARALRGFNIEAANMERVADVMAKTATRSTADIEGLSYAFKYAAGFAASLNVDIEQTAAAIGVLSDAGIDASMAGTGLRGVMAKLMNQSKPGEEILGAYKVQMDDINVKTNGLVNSLEKLKKAGVSSEALMATFGLRAGPSVIALINNLDALKQKINENYMAMGTVSKEQKIMDDNIYASWKRLVSAMEAFVTETGKTSGAINFIRSSFDKLADAVKWLTDNSNYLLPIVGIMVARFTGLGAVMRTTATGIGAVATASAGASLAGLRLNASLVAVAASARAATAAGNLLKGAYAFIGGWPGILLGVASFLLPIISRTEESVGVTEKLSSAWHDMYENGLSAKEAVKKFDQQIKNMTKGELELEVKANELSLKKMKDSIQAEIDSWNTDLNFTDWWSALVPAKQDIIDPLLEIKKQIKTLHEEFTSGKITVDEYRNSIAEVRLETISSHPEFDKSVQKLQNWIIQVQLAIAAGHSLASAIKAAESALISLSEEVDESAGLVVASLERLKSSTQTALYIQKQAKGSRDFLKKLQEAGIDVEKEIERIDDKLGVIWKSTSKYKNDAGMTKLVNDAYAASKQIENLKNEEKELAKVSRKNTSGRIKSSPIGTSDITGPLKQIEKLRNEIEELNGTSNKGVSKLSEKMTEIMQVGQKAKLSAKEIESLQTQYSDAFKSKTLKDFNMQLMNLEGATDKIQQIKFDETIREWEQKLTGIGLSSEEVAAKIKLLRDSLDQSKFSENLNKYGNLAFLLDANIEKSASYQKMLQRENDNLAASLKTLGVEIDANKNKWIEMYNESKMANGLLAGLIDGYLDGLDKARNWSSLMKDIFTETFDGLADTISDFIVKGQADFAKFTESLINDITKMIAKMLVMRAIMGLVGIVGGSFMSSNFGTTTGTVTSSTQYYPAGTGGAYGLGMAYGGTARGGSLASFSNSIVTQPTPFTYASANGRYAKGAGLMGEAGWEAIMPLGRTSDGRLGVQATNNSVSPIVNINITNESGQNVSATGQAVDNGTGGFDLDIIIAQVDQKMTQRAKQGKSSFAQYQEKAYGMNRAGVITRAKGRV